MLLAGLLATVPAAGSPEPTAAILAPGASSVRIPGTRLRLGQAFAEIAATVGFHAASATGAPARLGGTCRFFGLDSRAALEFEGDRLARAVFELDSLSAHSNDYVQDQLRRLGYRPRWEVLEPGRHECEWNGATRVVIKLDHARLTAEVTPASRERPPMENLPTATPLADRDSTLPDTLAIGRATGRYPAPEYAPTGSGGATPRYPDAARRAGVQGVVRVLARVDTSGAVIETALVRGIPELDAAALEAVRAWRFRPYVFEGRPWSFRVIVPVVFTLH